MTKPKTIPDRTFGGTQQLRPYVYSEITMFAGRRDVRRGISCVQDSGTAFVLSNWTTLSSKNKDIGAVTLCDVHIASVITKGHARCNGICAHNLNELPTFGVHYITTMF